MGAEAHDTWVPLSSRAEWADVHPADEAVEPGVPVVSIAYSSKDAQILGYFYAVVAAGEKSQRVLDLTEEVQPCCA